MCLLAIDLGGTKLAIAVFTCEGVLLREEKIALNKRKGKEVGQLINEQIKNFLIGQEQNGEAIHSIGISVPGIYHSNQGTVWAPNIQGWEQYPLLEEIKNVAGTIAVSIDCDRSCYI